MIYENITDLIGNTPLLRVGGLQGQVADLLLKLERNNPGGSAKDRVALSMILDAEKRGVLSPGATIVEPTSGNTGVGLAWVGAVRGYRVLLTMPETMSVERRALLRAYGAELVLTPAAEGMAGAIARANQLVVEIPNAVILGQFDNAVNPEAHFRTTGEEIWRDTEGKIDIFVASVGTGGTISGTARLLKNRNPKVKCVAVEPQKSPVLSGGKAGQHAIQGIGAGFVPATYDASVVDGVVQVSDENALSSMKHLAQKHGLLVGISSGATFWAALQMACDSANRGKQIVALMPDTGERYLSLF